MPARKPAPKAGFFCVGVISGAHGLRGEVMVHLFTEDPEVLIDYGVPVDHTGAPYRFSSLRPTPKGVLAKVDGVTDRTKAEILKGIHLYLPLSALPPVDEDTLYHAELEGMAVHRTGAKLGTVTRVEDYGAGVLIVVATPKGEVYLPFATVGDVDKTARVLTLTDEADGFLNV
jgi:16S rRNA processing protein RimM